MRVFEYPVAPQSGIGRVVLGVLVAVLATVALLTWSPANAYDSDAPKAESPYFQVASSDASTDRLPLKSTQVDVRIAGVIADVTVTQHYRNEGQRPIEARYVFPGSTSAAVYAMNVRLGERLPLLVGHHAGDVVGLGQDAIGGSPQDAPALDRPGAAT